ncbi:MAG: patatin-like phospholipase family protein [Candidatus Korobacteraceae bacterium]
MPNSYLTRLLKEAVAYFRDKDMPRELTDCDSTMAANIASLAKPNQGSDQPARSIDELSRDLAVLPLFQERLSFVVNYSPSKWLLEQEQPYLKARREMHGLQAAKPEGKPYRWASEQRVQGICLSGGGIRSATFNLGVLQGLASLDLLKNFDYLSSVSGGGYIHEFLAAWIKREEERKKTDSEEYKKTQPEGSRNAGSDEEKKIDADAARYKKGDGFDEVVKLLAPLPNQDRAAFHPEPIKWLRRYSNYLTPAKGAFSADMWVAIAIWMRNAFLNQIVLLSGLLMVVLLVRLVARGLSVAIPPMLLAWSIALLFLIVAAYLAVALHREYVRIRQKDLSKAKPASKVVDWKWLDRARPPLRKLEQRILDRPWLSGEGAARLLGVLPLLLAACLSAFTLSAGVFVDASFVVLEIFLCFLVVGLAMAFFGGAWREYSVCKDGSPRQVTWGGIWLCFYSAFIAALLGSLAFAGSWMLLNSVWLRLLDLPRCQTAAIAVFGPPLLLGLPFLTIVFGAGLVGRNFPDWMREWLARLRAWSLMIGIFWVLAFGIVLFGPLLVDWLLHHSGPWIATIKWSAVAAWAATTAGSLLAGKSGKTSGRKDDPQPNYALNLLALAGPYVYIVGLLVLLSWGAFKLAYLPGEESPVSILVVFVVSAAMFVIFGLRVDINEFSLNSFYRNRLTRCYLGATNTHRDPSPLTGFDDRDTSGMQISRLLPKTPRAMAGGVEKDDFVPYTGPFPIICTTLNLTFGEDLAWQERKAASFAFTPLYSGYTVGWTSGKQGDKLSFNGFVPTYNYGFPDGGINIATAVAISGAAASPNWGYHSNPATAFLMTMFDVRLGWWICNPRTLTGLAGADPLVPERSTDPASPRFAPAQLTKELLGMTDDTSNYVYLSDGGHFDNMGLYELVRRRCYRILICDGEEDENYVFEGLGMAIRKCRIDFGVEIQLSDLKELRLNKKTRCSSAHFATGTIRYPEAGGGGPEWKDGEIIYLKSSLTGTAKYLAPGETKPTTLCTEPADILNYKLQHPNFPHDTTLNQWFTESQFESYRRLGCHVVEEIQSCGLWKSFGSPPPAS